ncbi:MAG: MBL fold metallo-hydrolase [Rhodospirillaceae bacterium]|nr:MBL fold metallo-hydrolase [Rhodospirillaceae bacterium]
MTRLTTMAIAAFLLLFALPASGLEISRDALFVRVIDVGNGHAAVISMPGGHYMVYDTGLGETTLQGVQSVIPEGEDIDLMILSHTDGDHIGGVDEILEHYSVKTIIRPGLPRDTDAWCQARTAIRAAEKNGTKVINLAKTAVPAGRTFRYGDTRVVFVSGFSKPPKSWGELTPSEFYNAGSVVVRIVFAGRSILFTGDAVGLKLCKSDPCHGPESIIATEKYMVDNAANVPIASDVLIAPHHGSRGSSSLEFITAVSPKWVIFPAGRSSHDHPHQAAAKRYLALTPIPTILRTDRHDDEGKEEWACGRIEGHRDRKGDDDVDIGVLASGDLTVAYRDDTPPSLPQCITN